MGDQHRKYTSSNMMLLPWPRGTAAGEGLLTTRWWMDFDRKLTETDLDVVSERLRMQDPTLQASVTFESDNRMVIVFTWRGEYNGEAMSRSVVALKLITQVVGWPANLQGRPVTDWPFIALA